MSEKLHSYELPQVANILAELDKFGAVIAGSLYYLLVAVVIVFYMPWCLLLHCCWCLAGWDSIPR